jgi:tRNA (adenine37-N6)-methyltransferase
MQALAFTPIGIIRSPFQEPTGMPIQTVAAQGAAGTLELEPQFAGALKDLHEFSHLWLLVHLHRSAGFALDVTPFMDDQSHGVFATRAPRRPNPIGLSLVKLVRVEGCTLQLEELDVLDGTPVLDIKPYVPRLDRRSAERIGWFKDNIQKVFDTRADDRFRHD